MQQRAVIVTTGKDRKALDWLEDSLAAHLDMVAQVETLRLGNVRSLFAAYHNAARMIDDDRAWLVFAHQDVRPFHTHPGDPLVLPALPETASWLGTAFRDPFHWLDVAGQLLDRDDTGFLGVSGACDLDESVSWWNGRRLTGAILHQSDGPSPRINAYGPWGRAAVLDGVFLMTRGATFGKMEPPRPSLKRFHFYDLELCLNAHRAGLKNWTVPLLLLHESGGATVESTKWRKDLLRFLKRYSNDLPLEIPFEPLSESR